jgi:polar amino acid transport system substrate-binding protein
MKHMRALLILVVLFAAASAQAQTLARIQRNGGINLGFIPDQRPFSYSLTKGLADGYAVELCRHVANTLKTRLGMPQLNVTYVAASAATSVELIEHGQIDLLCGPINETLRARERVSFSTPIYVSGIGALVRTDAPASLLRVLNGEVAQTGPTWRATVNAGLANHVYAVHAGTATEALVRQRITDFRVIAKVVAVRTHEEGLALVANRRADAYFADRAMLIALVVTQSENERLRVLDRRFTLAPIALAMQRGDEDFRLVVDGALSELYRSSGFLETYARYFGRPTETARLLMQAYAIP